MAGNLPANLALVEATLRRQSARRLRALERADEEYARLIESCRSAFAIGLTKEAIIRLSGLSRMTVYRALASQEGADHGTQDTTAATVDQA